MKTVNQAPSKVHLQVICVYLTRVENENKTLYLKEQLACALELLSDQQQLGPEASEKSCPGCEIASFRTFW